MDKDNQRLLSVLIHFKESIKTGSDLREIYCRAVKSYESEYNIIINFLQDDIKGELEKLLNEKDYAIPEKYEDCEVYYIKIPFSEINSFDVRIDE